MTMGQRQSARIPDRCEVQVLAPSDRGEAGPKGPAFPLPSQGLWGPRDTVALICGRGLTLQPMPAKIPSTYVYLPDARAPRHRDYPGRGPCP
jgi:hypothetical protein